MTSSEFERCFDAGDSVLESLNLASARRSLQWDHCPAVERDPQRVSGAWVFRGTRIPVAALFQNLEDGVSLAEFVELFPGVSLEQAQEVALMRSISGADPQVG